MVTEDLINQRLPVSGPFLATSTGYSLDDRLSS